MKKVTFTLLAGTMVLSMLATSCKKDDKDDDTTTTTTPTLYTRLGGDAAIAAVTDQFITNVLADPTIADNFAATGADSYRFQLFRERLIDQLCDATGGPYTYRGANMYDAHDGMNITDAEFTALVGALVAALDQFNVPATEKNELLAILGPMQSDIVGH
jgi:hemoglobin